MLLHGKKLIDIMGMTLMRVALMMKMIVDCDEDEMTVNLEDFWEVMKKI